jgi:hypothetical protein
LLPLPAISASILTWRPILTKASFFYTIPPCHGKQPSEKFKRHPERSEGSCGKLDTLDHIFCSNKIFQLLLQQDSSLRSE